MVDLTLIKEDMTVYDMNNNKIGEVDFVKFGDEDPNEIGTETATVAEHEYNPPYDSDPNLFWGFVVAFDGDNDDIPEEHRAYLLRYGYLRLDTGNLFESDYFVPLNQVERVTGENVYIRTTKDELISD